MRLILTIITLVSLIGCDPVLEKQYSNLKETNSATNAKNEELVAKIQELEVEKTKIKLQVERQETEASLYLGCSWPVNLCPGPVAQAGKSAIEAGRGGGRSWQVWMFRSIWLTSFWLIACCGIFLFNHLFTIYTGPKKAEIEKHKKLMEDLEEASQTIVAKAENQAEAVFQAAKERERKMANNLEQATQKLTQVNEQTSTQQAELANAKQELFEINAALAQAKKDLEKMEMLKNAMRSGS